MNCKEELIRIWDECIEEIFEGEELTEDDKLDFDIVKESIIAQIKNEKVSEEDQKYVCDNIELYKKFFMAMLTSNEKEMKLVTLELLKIKNK